MTRLDLRLSAAGNVRRNKAARFSHGETYNLSLRTLVSLVASFVEVWCVR
jgi:hypothetical protein